MLYLEELSLFIVIVFAVKFGLTYYNQRHIFRRVLLSQVFPFFSFEFLYLFIVKILYMSWMKHKAAIFCENEFKNLSIKKCMNNYVYCILFILILYQNYKCEYFKCYAFVHAYGKILFLLQFLLCYFYFKFLWMLLESPSLNKGFVYASDFSNFDCVLHVIKFSHVIFAIWNTSFIVGEIKCL